MTWIKICGITNLQDALQAATLEVDALGFIFAPSPRRIDPLAAREIVRSLPPSVFKIGVFVDEEISEVRRIADDCGLNGLQFHGQESPEYCQEFPLPVIKTIAVRSIDSLREMEKYSSVSILLDAWSAERAGGSGKAFCWEWAGEAWKKRDFILSGGLNPMNVYQAVQRLKPVGVDVCSGVEQIPGKKNLWKMIDFVKEVKRADGSTR
ncbi:MAG: phosphoribosylanthranilate isomerase [Proteobacteria bacterium]|nr:phosphoribosylanthranilate isomerase [Pseudomonadota bacterium]